MEMLFKDIPKSVLADASNNIIIRIPNFLLFAFEAKTSPDGIQLNLGFWPIIFVFDYKNGSIESKS